jgi:enoyl reductase-like protein/acyl dehydratase
MESSLLVFRGAGQRPLKTLKELLSGDDSEILTKFAVDMAGAIEETIGEHKLDCSRRGIVNFDLLSWLSDPDILDADFINLRSCFWQPLNTVTQLTTYYKFALDTGSWDHTWSGCVGHSQGNMPCAAAAMSSDHDTFVTNAKIASQYQFWQGVLSVDPVVQIGDEFTPMMLVRGLDHSQLTQLIEQENCPGLQISLQNQVRTFVVTGQPGDLKNFQIKLNDLSGDDNQGRVPFTQRKPTIKTAFLEIQCAGHNATISKDVPDDILSRMPASSKDFVGELRFPLFSAMDGHSLTSDNLLLKLSKMQMCENVNWVDSVNTAIKTSNAQRFVDFGPGGKDGLYLVTMSNVEGTGVGSFAAGIAEDYEVLCSVGSGKSDFPEPPMSWADNYAIKNQNGKLVTKFTEVFGKPPVMVAGMTPCTVWPEIVSGFYSAGFHGELAGGGLPTEEMFRENIHEISQKIPAGEGITINMLYLNARLWDLQFNLSLKMIKEGYPINGITIAAGVPSPDTGFEILEKSYEHGIRTVNFKPGAEKAIRSVLEIAELSKDALPGMNIVLQWTSGRAGGHHSYEDFHDPMFKLYKYIRRHDNVILAIGGGFGNAESSVDYLTGAWSEQYGYPKMPFDAVLFGSAMMVAKECRLCDAAKEALVAAPGIGPEENWEKSYEGVTGGCITCLSEFGEPIHALATRCAVLWKEMDNKYFTQPLEERAAKIMADKEWIIEQLNANHQKVYFGELREMTYPQVVKRFKELTVRPNGDFIHPHFEQKFNMVAEQFEGLDGWLTQDDIDFFITTCRAPRMKPINFVPVIDENLAFWYKKDSLWYAEDIESLPELDVQRAFILQSPVSVRYIKECNKPIGEMLQAIVDGYKSLVPEQAADNSSEDLIEIFKSTPYLVEDGKQCSNKYTKMTLQEDNGNVTVQILDGLDLKFKHCPETKANPFHLVGTSRDAFLPYFKQIVPKVGPIELTKGDIEEFIGITGVSAANAPGALLTARSVWMGFGWLLDNYPLHPLGIIHLSNAFTTGEHIEVDAAITPSFEVKEIALMPDGQHSRIAMNTYFGRNGLMQSEFMCKVLPSVPGSVEPVLEDFRELEESTMVCEKKRWVPGTSQNYVKSSWDTNPSHQFDHVAALAGLKQKIVHGMWTLTASLPDEFVTQSKFYFDGPLKLNDRIQTKIERVGVRAPEDVLMVETRSQSGGKVLHGHTAVRGVKQVIVYTGQGSLRPNAGMDLYASSKLAKDVWDKADSYFVENYGISLLYLIKNNPTTYTILMNTDKLRENYKTLLGVEGKTHTFYKSNGLIYATQFTQVITLILEMVGTKVLNEQRVLDKNCLFAGHSLGEYGAIVSQVPVVKFEKVIELTFLRGITMQQAVKRDENGESAYRMVSVDPSRLGKTVDDLHSVVNEVNEKGGFVQIVNYNVKGKQYILAGEISSLVDTLSGFEGTTYTTLKRTRCGIPLVGIDVPFHSRLLATKVDQFRDLLTNRSFTEANIDPALLNGRYIPNLVGIPFQLSEDFVKTCLDYCDSKILADMLDNWSKMDDMEKTRLILIELLAYQFASPVQWIKTQETLFSLGARQSIEVGPTPVLTRMMQKTFGKTMDASFWS